MDHWLWAHRRRRQPGLTITQEQASALLLQDVASAVAAVNRLVTVPLTQNQFDALVDFTFNSGQGNLASSTLLRELNAGNTAGAAAQFLVWVYAGGVKLPGLVKRRQAEVGALPISERISQNPDTRVAVIFVRCGYA